jgi:hypothetical protein
VGSPRFVDCSTVRRPPAGGKLMWAAPLHADHGKDDYSSL